MKAATVFAVFRAGYGLVEATAPDLLAQRLFRIRLDAQARRVARVIGVRHVVQAAASGPAPTRAVLRLGAEVDVLHAASMVGLAALDRRQRRSALASAVMATGFAVAGAVLARRTRDRNDDSARESSALAARDRFAARIAGPALLRS